MNSVLPESLTMTICAHLMSYYATATMGTSILKDKFYATLTHPSSAPPPHGPVSKFNIIKLPQPLPTMVKIHSQLPTAPFHLPQKICRIVKICDAV